MLREIRFVTMDVIRKPFQSTIRKAEPNMLWNPLKFLPYLTGIYFMLGWLVSTALIQPAFSQEVIIPSDAPTASSYLIQEGAMWNEIYQYYDQGSPDDVSLHGDAKQFLRDFVRWKYPSSQGETSSETSGVVTAEALVASGEQLIQRGCQDPLVLSRYAGVLNSLGESQKALRIAKKADSMFAGSSYPPGIRLEILRELQLAQKTRNIKAATKTVQRRIYGLAPDWFDFVLAVPGDHSITVRLRLAFSYFLKAISIGSFELQPYQAAVQEYAGSESKDDWLAAMLEGKFNFDAAWFFRGSSYASEVKEDRWQKFSDYGKQANESLLKAYKIRSDIPFTADHLLKSARDGFSDESPVTWFNRCIEVEMDFMPAYHNLLWTLRPRWGGSRQQMLDFGEQCLATKRFDTDIPYMYFEAFKDVIDEMRSDGDDENEFIREPGIYENLASFFQGYVDQFAVDGDDGLNKLQAKYLTRQLAYATETDHFEDAVKLWDQLGEKADHAVLDSHHLRREYDQSRANAYLEFGDKMIEVRDLTIDHRTSLQECIKVRSEYQNLLRQSENPKSHLYLQTWVERGRIESRFHAGGWVNLDFDSDLRNWRGRKHQWEVVSKSEIIGTTEKGRLVMTHACRFYGPKEVMCEIELIEKSTKLFRFGVCLGVGQNRRLCWIEPTRNFMGITGPSKAISMEIIPNIAKALHIRAYGPQAVEFYADGQRSSDIALPGFEVGGAVGLYNMWGDPDQGKVRVKNLKVRKLTATFPKTFEDYQAVTDFYESRIANGTQVADDYFRLAGYYKRIRQWDNAILNFQEYLTHFPNQLYAYWGLAECLCKSGRYDEGLKAYETAIQSTGKLSVPKAYIAIEHALILVTHPGATEQDARHALKLIAAHTKGRRFRTSTDKFLATAISHTILGDFDKASKSLIQAKKKVGPNPSSAQMKLVNDIGDAIEKKIAYVDQEEVKQKDAKQKEMDSTDEKVEPSEASTQ